MQGNREIDLLGIFVQDVQPLGRGSIVLDPWTSIFSVNELVRVVAIDKCLGDVDLQAIEVAMCFPEFLPLHDVPVETQTWFYSFVSVVMAIEKFIDG